MVANRLISLGLGSPSSVEHFITLGLEAGADVLLTGGETGYAYKPPAEAVPSLVTEPAGAPPGLGAGPAAGGAPTYMYGP
jgi:hypothetical protein